MPFWRPSKRPALLAKSGDREAPIAAYDRIAAAARTRSELSRACPVALGHAEPARGRSASRRSIASHRLTASGNPWRPTALELTALARLKSGDKSGALDLYKSLADDLAAPQSLRARAAEMAAALAS